MLTFFLAMTLYPQIQRSAQRELDEVVGSGRLPEFSDRDSLPYITAVIKECSRWQPVAPLGLPHKNTAEHIYKDGAVLERASCAQTTELYPSDLQCHPWMLRA